MKRITVPDRFFALCGMSPPVLFVGLTILGGALRPGYSHFSETISELFSPGSPNKPLLDTLHATFALLLVLFGIGILRFVRRVEQSRWMGTLAAGLFIIMGGLSVMTATIFHKTPGGLPPHFLVRCISSSRGWLVCFRFAPYC